MPTYTVNERRVTTWDGTELFYRAWLAGNEHKKALVIFHRGHEHSGRLANLVELLDMKEFAVFAWDARGNGRSPGKRDYADHFMDYVRDADHFVRHVSSTYHIAISDIAVIANSVGGVIAATWVHDYAPPIRALVLAAPAFRIKLYVPLAIPLLRLAQKLGVMENVKSYVKSVVLTHDRDEQDAFNNDPLISNSISTNVLIDLHDTSTRIMADAGAMNTPVLLLTAGSDWVVQKSPQDRFFQRLSSRVKEKSVYPDFFHAIFHEKDRRVPIDATRTFILRQFSGDHDHVSLLNADRSGYTKREFDRLNQPSFNILFPMIRAVMKTVGKLGTGIKIGWDCGFDSGVMLDHVYKNVPAGVTPLGRLIDRIYINSVGWAGIRVRKNNLEALLRNYIELLDETGRAIHIVDVAAGPGRYILDTIRSMPAKKITATLRDYQEINIKEGRRLAEEMAIGCVEYVQGNAFHREELAAQQPAPTLSIVSGLFELIPDNKPVLDSLRGLADAMVAGSYLIYTAQPWHPQLEFIARVLTNREGKPWIMRRRTQAEMDELVREAGFEKIEMRIDNWGIFTVSVARRVPFHAP